MRRFSITGIHQESREPCTVVLMAPTIDEAYENARLAGIVVLEMQQVPGRDGQIPEDDEVKARRNKRLGVDQEDRIAAPIAILMILMALGLLALGTITIIAGREAIGAVLLGGLFAATGAGVLFRGWRELSVSRRAR